jgi:hypothetical protein
MINDLKIHDVMYVHGNMSITAAADIVPRETHSKVHWFSGIVLRKQASIINAEKCKDIIWIHIRRRISI